MFSSGGRDVLGRGGGSGGIPSISTLGVRGRCGEEMLELDVLPWESVFSMSSKEWEEVSCRREDFSSSFKALRGVLFPGGKGRGGGVVKRSLCVHVIVKCLSHLVAMVVQAGRDDTR